MTTENSQLLRAYFHSIEPLLQGSLASRKPGRLRGVLGAATIVLLISSVIPLVPTLLARTAPVILKSNFLTIGRYRVPLTSSHVWWSICVVVFTGSTALWAKWVSSNKKKNKRKWLSDAQLRFAICYAIVEEIGRYQTNGRAIHADLALEYWRALRVMLLHLFRPAGSLLPGNYPPAALPSPYDLDQFWNTEPEFALYPEIDALKRRFPWFRLDAKTEFIVKALYELPARIQDRLQDKKDLAEISDYLDDLSAYLYGEIPDVPGRVGSESAAEYADRHLWAFCEKLSKQGPYSTEQETVTQPARFWTAVGSAVHGATIPFSHSNLFVCFLAWYIFTLALTLLGLRAALHFLPNMTIDSILVSLIVGGPLACAVSAVAISRPRKRETPASGE